MAQLGRKVNHFGDPDVSNLYKNQQITNRLDSVLVFMTGPIARRSQRKCPTVKLFTGPDRVRGDKKVVALQAGFADRCEIWVIFVLFNSS